MEIVPVLCPALTMSPILLVADGVSLGPGEAAMIPAAIQVQFTGEVHILPNTDSMVRCANGVWNSRERMPPIHSRCKLVMWWVRLGMRESPLRR